jgi:hypothetical protein
MHAKSFYALVAAAAVALGAALWISRSNQPSSESNLQNTPLLPGLRDELNSIDAVTFVGAGNQAIASFKRAPDGWHIAEKSGFPADVSKLRELLLKLADANVIEAKTANPARYAELGVEDPAGAKCDAPAPNTDAATTQKKCIESKGVLVTLGGLKTPLRLIVGLYNGGGGGGTFVRRDGEARSLLVAGNLAIDRNAAAWVRHEIVDIDSARIKEVRLTGLDGKTLRVYKEQSTDASFKVADVPAGRALASDFVANSLGSGLSSLRADDVAAAKDMPAPPDALARVMNPNGRIVDKTASSAFKVHYLAFGGLAFDVIAWDADGKNLIQLVASNDAAQLDSDITTEQAKAKASYDTSVAAAKLKAVEAKGDDAAIAKAEADVPKPASLSNPDQDRAERIAVAKQVADDLNKTFAGWTFVVPAYEFANFNKSMEELLKPLTSKPVLGITPLPPGQTRANDAPKL